MGRRGRFWEIAEGEIKKYPNYSRQVVPWWLCSFFCHDVDEASKIAPILLTEERVMRFGTSDLIDQYDALDLDDFQQEFECIFVDASYSYYPFDLILPCTDNEHEMADDFIYIPKPTGRIVAGFDVGRMRDKSELAVFEERDGRFGARMFKSYDKVPFAEQETDLRVFLETLPVARLSIDNSGLGMHMAENLANDYPVVQPENFTNDNKERWATNFKILLQKRKVRLPGNKALVSQAHSIKRQVLPSGKVSFDSERGRGGHADRFWAVAMACQKEKQTIRTLPEIIVRII